MANIFSDDFAKKNSRNGTFGAAWTDTFTINKPAAIGDKIYLGVLYPSVIYTDIDLNFDALGAGATLSLGYEAYASGSNLTAAPIAPNLTYWQSGLSVAAAGGSASRAHAIEFADAVALVATVAGGAITGRITATPIGNGVGVK